MRVLTFGWEYPPKRNGGLGVACYGLTRELLGSGIEVTFVMPRQQPVSGPGRFIFADIAEPVTSLEPAHSGPYYASESVVYVTTGLDGVRRPSGRRVIDEVYAFAEAARRIAKQEEFDIIHAHDWTSYLAGVVAKEVSAKPLILHVHATSFDQAAGDYVDPTVYDIERRSFAVADCIATVSDYTRRIVVEKHGASPEKVEVIHNGVDLAPVPHYHPPSLAELKAAGKKIVLYHGRITIQKGVDYFVKAAKRVLTVEPNVIFVISGWGDMQEQVMRQVGESGLSEHVLFAGALWEEERDRMYQTADLVVMPSVSEPFGLIPLEALHHGTPSVISKQSGVGEVLPAALRVDFWDVEEMANKIAAGLRYPVLNQQLVQEGRQQLLALTWQRVAVKVRALYERLLQLVRPAITP